VRRPTAECGVLIAAAWFSLGVAVACRTPILMFEPADRVPSGIWGGDRVQLNVTEQGATTEYDCAHGTIDRPLEVDGTGRFSVTGTHVREHGGPARENEPDDRHPATYEGRMNGDALTLTVTLTDTREDIGTFSLRRDIASRLHKCM
jgi:hypothetical protein